MKSNGEHGEETLLSTLEHELGGVQVYRAALACVEDEKLRAEWETCLSQTRAEVASLEKACAAANIDARRETLARRRVRRLGAAFVGAIERAKREGGAAAAQRVARQCVALERVAIGAARADNA